MDSAPEPFRCDVIPERSAVRLAVHGELDVATAPEFAATLAEVHDAGFREIILDLRELEFLDSTAREPFSTATAERSATARARRRRHAMVAVMSALARAQPARR